MHVNPLSASRILVDTGSARLVYAKVERPHRWLWLSNCTRRVPRILWTMLAENTVVYEYVEGRTLADVVLEDLALSKIGEAILHAWTLGVELAHLHSELEEASCFEGEWTTLQLLDDRCRLAREAGIEECPKLSSRVKYTAYGHGDPHMYQVIVSGANMIFIDLDGEPGSRVPGPPEYDLAAAARSIYYAAIMAGTPGSARRLAAAMVGGYCRERRIDLDLLSASYKARVAYEYYFERIAHTGLEWIPESSLKQLVSGREPVLETMVGVASACRG